MQIYFYKKETRGGWYTLVILVFGKWRQEDQEVQGHSQLWSEFKANLAYMRPCLKKKEKNQME